VLLLNLSLILEPAGASSVSLSYLNSVAPLAVPISSDTRPAAAGWVAAAAALAAVGFAASETELVAARAGWVGADVALVAAGAGADVALVAAGAGAEPPHATNATIPAARLHRFKIRPVFAESDSRIMVSISPLIMRRKWKPGGH